MTHRSTISRADCAPPTTSGIVRDRFQGNDVRGGSLWNAR